MKYLLVFCLLAGMLARTAQADYVPPVGIPAPAFGANESVTMYLDPSYTWDYGSGQEPYRTANGLPYTYYVDKDAANSTDTANTYGSPALPRKTWPYPLAAGACVQVHGTNYTFKNAPGSILVVGGTGTPSRPIFLYGVSSDPAAMPAISRTMQLFGNYTIIEKIKSGNNAMTAVRPSLKGASIIGVTLRDCYFQGLGTNIGNTAVFSASIPTTANRQTISSITPGTNGIVTTATNHLLSNGMSVLIQGATSTPSINGFQTVTVLSPTTFTVPVEVTSGSAGGTVALYTRYLMVLRCTITDWGVIDTLDENDATGFIAGAYCYDAWFLDSECARMGGDGARIGADQGSAAGGSRIYVGRNHLHHNRENAIDVKQARQAVCSENDCHDFSASSSSGGTAIAVHYGGQDVWMLNNKIHDCVAGISSSGVGGDFHFIGNVVYDVTNKAVDFDRGGGNFFCYNNTIYNCGYGFTSSSSITSIKYRNNIVRGITGGAGHYAIQLNSTSVAAAAEANTFILDPAALIYWGGNSYSTPAAWMAATGKGVGTVTTDPLFSDTATNDFRLTDGSSAVDAGITIAEVDTAMSAIFSGAGSILKDIAGTTRPHLGVMDIGAFEAPTPPGTPVITSALGAIATQGDPFTYQIVSENFPSSYSATGLPAGLTLNTTTGLISGTPTTLGSSTATISAINVTGSDSESLTITVELSRKLVPMFIRVIP